MCELQWINALRLYNFTTEKQEKIGQKDIFTNCNKLSYPPK